jgi:hypothetical protein
MFFPERFYSGEGLYSTVTVIPVTKSLEAKLHMGWEPVRIDGLPFLFLFLRKAIHAQNAQKLEQEFK